MDMRYHQAIIQKTNRLFRLYLGIKRKYPKNIVDDERELLKKSERKLSVFSRDIRLEQRIAEAHVIEEIEGTQDEMLDKGSCFSCQTLIDHIDKSSADVPGLPLCAERRLGTPNKPYCSDRIHSDYFAEHHRMGSTLDYKHLNEFLKEIQNGFYEKYKEIK